MSESASDKSNIQTESSIENVKSINPYIENKTDSLLQTVKSSEQNYLRTSENPRPKHETSGDKSVISDSGKVPRTSGISNPNIRQDIRQRILQSSRIVPQYGSKMDSSSKP